jgi:hypothetical protein
LKVYATDDPSAGIAVINIKGTNRLENKQVLPILCVVEKRNVLNSVESVNLCAFEIFDLFAI